MVSGNESRSEPGRNVPQLKNSYVEVRTHEHSNKYLGCKVCAGKLTISVAGLRVA